MSNANLLDCLSSFLFLRTYSLQLQISPFEIDAFSSCLSSLSHNALLDEIHCVLLKVCSHNIKEELQSSLDWSLLDHFTWSEYLLPLLLQYQDSFQRTRAQVKEDECDHEEDSELQELSVVIRLIDENAKHGINYIGMFFPEKAMILKCLISLLLTNEKFKTLLDYRGEIELESSDNEEREALPLFPKGEDGYPEECILCGMGGDLLCCDVCPAVYHQGCLHTGNLEFLS
jgi:hypothetical protein